MSSMAIVWIVFACVFGGSLLGMFLRSVVTEKHLTGDTKDVVTVATALIATELVQLSPDIVQLDRVLAHYGPDAKDTRSALRDWLVAGIERFWPINGARPIDLKPTISPFEAICDQTSQLSLQNNYQRSLKAQALTATTDLGHIRFPLFDLGTSIPVPFIIVIVFWLTVIFASFGLFALANTIVTSVFVVCALSVSGALFLILELDRSYTRMIQVSSAPLRQALAHLGL